MGFTIPNQEDAFHTNQAEPDKVDIDILAAGLKGEGVFDGCGVTPKSPESTTVAVASGNARIDGSSRVVGAGDIDCGSASGSYARFDLIVVNSSSVKSVVNGTASTNPVFPDIPSVSVVLAAIYRPVDDDAISAVEITDKRVILAGSLLDLPRQELYIPFGDVPDSGVTIFPTL